MMKSCSLILLAFLIPNASKAQTSCSADVPKEVCDTVTMGMEVLDHHILAGVSIPVELVTPEEYKKRLDDFRREGETNDKNIINPTCGKPSELNSPQCVAIRERFFAWIPLLGYTHTRVMFNQFSKDVSFLRDRPTSTEPDRILMSVDACRTLGKQLPPDKDGMTHFAQGDYDTQQTFRMVAYVVGFVEGAFSSKFD